MVAHQSISFEVRIDRSRRKCIAKNWIRRGGNMGKPSKTAFFSAARARDWQSVTALLFLLRRRANASYSLWAAVWRDDEMVCRALLKSRPNLNLQAHGETPIFYAARLKRLATLAMLIDAGADPSIVDPKGRDALTIARERRLPEQIIEKLESLRHKLHGPLPKRA